jgi:beta-1,4-mannosyltransferase
MKVLMMPDYRSDNPYQILLSATLQREGVSVLFPSGYRRIFPIYRAIKDQSDSVAVLHLHWIDPYIKGENAFVKLIYCIKFLIDILLIRWHGTRVVWTVHNIVSHNSRFPSLELWTQRILSRLIDRAIVHHCAVIDEVSQCYNLPRHKIAVVPHGHYREVYPVAIDSTEARRKLGLLESQKIYLNFGMLKPYKGIERLIQTWKTEQSTNDSTLLIVGKALDESYGEKLAEQASGTKNIVLQNSFIENDQIHWYFSAADIVVLPFESILTSGSLILAMSYGKPVIAPRSPGIVETLGHATHLLYAEPELGQAIQKSTQVDLDKLSHRVSRECDRLDWAGIGKRTYQIYQHPSGEAS